MTAVDLTDLDIAAPSDRRVKVGGQTFKVPGDPPTGWLLAFRSLTAKFDGDDVDELAVIEELRDAVVDLFCIRQPDREADILGAIDGLGVPVLVQAVNLIYRAETGPVEDEPPARPTRTASTRKTSSRTSRPAPSASSSSSES